MATIQNSADEAAPRVARQAVLKQILILALPALMQQGLLLIIQLYDQFLAGQFSQVHQAALTTANYLYWFTTSYTVIVNAGATALVGRLVGGQDWMAANRAVGQALLAALAFGLLGTTVGLIGLPTLIDSLGLRDAGAAYALAYLKPLTLLLPAYMIEAGAIACLVGAGDTRTGLKTLMLVVAVNSPLAWGFSHGSWGLPNLGFVGIAWGTAIAHLIGCTFVLTTLIRGRFGLKLSWTACWFHGGLMSRLLRVSIPAAFDSLSIGMFQFVFLGIVNRIGESAAAAHGIAIRLEGLGYLSGAAFATATAALVARALGEKRPDLAARAGWTAFVCAAVFMSFMGLLFYVFAHDLFALFSRGEGQAEVIAVGVPALRLVAFAMPGLAASIVVTQALRAAGDARVPVLFTWVGFLGVRLPLAVLLTNEQYGLNLGLIGAWLAMFADIYIRGCFYLWRFAGGRWKFIRV